MSYFIEQLIRSVFIVSINRYCVGNLHLLSIQTNSDKMASSCLFVSSFILPFQNITYCITCISLKITLYNRWKKYIIFIIKCTSDYIWMSVGLNTLTRGWCTKINICCEKYMLFPTVFVDIINIPMYIYTNFIILYTKTESSKQKVE